MRKFTLAAALVIPSALAIVVAAAPAFSCHRFSTWNYPMPQRCAASSHVAFHPPKEADKSYYVEITAPPPLPPPAPAPSLDGDQRTPAEIQDFDEHYEQLEKHKAEINRMMIILHAIEDSERANGLQ